MLGTISRFFGLTPHWQGGAALDLGRVKVHTRWNFVARGPDGQVKWRDYIDNLVVNEGLDDLLTQYFKGSGYTAAHYMLLTGGTPNVQAADTMASHSGWTEVTDYSQASRPQPTWGTVSGQSLDNSASPAVYSINQDNTTIGGACLCTDATKGGSTGTMYGGGAFTGGDKLLDSGDTLEVTATLTAAAS